MLHTWPAQSFCYSLFITSVHHTIQCTLKVTLARIVLLQTRCGQSKYDSQWLHVPHIFVSWWFFNTTQNGWFFNHDVWFFTLHRWFFHPRWLIFFYPRSSIFHPRWLIFIHDGWFFTPRWLIAIHDRRFFTHEGWFFTNEGWLFTHDGWFSPAMVDSFAHDGWFFTDDTRVVMVSIVFSCKDRNSHCLWF